MGAYAAYLDACTDARARSGVCNVACVSTVANGLDGSCDMQNAQGGAETACPVSGCAQCRLVCTTGFAGDGARVLLGRMDEGSLLGRFLGLRDLGVFLRLSSWYVPNPEF